jgi:hypothetical protein
VVTGEKQDGVLQANVDYTFTLTTASAIPMDGYFAITVPSEIGVTDGSMTLLCTFCSTEAAGTLEWDSGTRELKVLGIFSSSTDYLYGGSYIEFVIGGWTNPATTVPAYMTWTSYAVIDGTDYIIDSVSSLYVTVTLGELEVFNIYPTDSYRIYDMPTNYTISFNAMHNIETSYKI